MRLLQEIYSLIDPSEFDRGASKMKYPNVYKTKKPVKKKATKQSVIVKSSGKDGKIYGRKTIHQ